MDFAAIMEKTMTKSPGSGRATIVKTVVALAVILFLIAMMFPMADDPRKSMAARTMGNMRQLSLATQTMALDGATTGDTNLHWPGDGPGTFSNWVANLVPAYLSTNDFLKLMSGPGGRLTKMPTKNDGPVRVYAVSSNSPPDAVLFATANVIVAPDGTVKVDPAVKPFGDKTVVIFRRGGDGAVLSVNQTNVAGVYPPLLRD